MTTDQFENAPGWRPEPGETLVGIVARVDRGNNEFGPYPIVTVVKSDGSSVAVHAFHHSLRARLVELRPVASERIGIKYYGQVDTAASRAGTKSPAHRYVVRVDGRDVDVWGQMEVAPPAPAAPAAAPATPAAAEDDIPF